MTRYEVPIPFTAATPLPPGYFWANPHDPSRFTTCRLADRAADEQIAMLMEENTALRAALLPAPAPDDAEGKG